LAADPADNLNRLGQFDSIDDLIRLACEARNAPLDPNGSVVVGNPRGRIVVTGNGQVIVGGEASVKPDSGR
jgi:hypothetical protein